MRHHFLFLVLLFCFLSGCDNKSNNSCQAMQQKLTSGIEEKYAKEVHVDVQESILLTGWDIFIFVRNGIAYDIEKITKLLDNQRDYSIWIHFSGEGKIPAFENTKVKVLSVIKHGNKGIDFSALNKNTSIKQLNLTGVSEYDLSSLPQMLTLNSLSVKPEEKGFFHMEILKKFPALKSLTLSSINNCSGVVPANIDELWLDQCSGTYPDLNHRLGKLTVSRTKIHSNLLYKYLTFKHKILIFSQCELINGVTLGR